MMNVRRRIRELAEKVALKYANASSKTDEVSKKESEILRACYHNLLVLNAELYQLNVCNYFTLKFALLRIKQLQDKMELWMTRDAGDIRDNIEAKRVCDPYSSVLSDLDRIIFEGLDELESDKDSFFEPFRKEL